MMNLIIRRATAADIRSCAQIHIQSWKETYRGIVPDAYLNSLDVKKRIDLWKKLIDDVNSFNFVAEIQGIGVVGFVVCGAHRSPQFQGQGEIGAIYLLKKYHHQGVGLALFNRGFRVLKEKGFQKVSLWVLKDNPTCSFYTKMGGKVKQEQEIEIGGKKLIECAYCWDEIIEPNIFHITSKAEWDKALLKKFYAAVSFEKEGFIHFSDLHQVHRSGNLWCMEIINPVVLEVDPAKLKCELKYESADDSEFFPHVYGVIPVEAVVNIRELKKGSDGFFQPLSYLVKY